MKYLMLLISLLILACDKTDIEITNAITPVRSDTQNIYAAYLNIKNNTSSNIELIGIRSESFNSIMLHQSSVENGIAKMRHMEKLIIPQKTQVKLEPNGKHIMLMGAKEKLWEKDHITLVLEFSNGSSIEQNVTLKKPKKK